MSQSAVLRHCYDSLSGIFEDLGKSSGLFTIDKRDGKEPSRGAAVYLGVSDLAQVSQDKNGEKVFVDEKVYAAPTYAAFILAVSVRADSYPALLEVTGCIIRYFKDNPSFPIGDYSWHGMPGDQIYIEPVIREPARGKTVPESPGVILEYRVEAAVNSEIGV